MEYLRAESNLKSRASRDMAVGLEVDKTIFKPYYLQLLAFLSR